MTNFSDDRRETRYPFHWTVAIVFDSTASQDTYHGVTYELSLSGCSILMDDNVFSDQPVSILLAMPLDHPGQKKRVVEVKGRMVYTVLSAGHQQFRCGITFIKFKGNGRAALERAIKHRVIA